MNEAEYNLFRQSYHFQILGREKERRASGGERKEKEREARGSEKEKDIKEENNNTDDNCWKSRLSSS